MYKYLQKIKKIKSVTEADETLKELYFDTKNNNISKDDSRFIFDILSNIKNNEVLNEQTIDLNFSNKIAIAVAPEPNFNQGGATTYFKVYRKPTRCAKEEDCLRISVFSAMYIFHNHTLKDLLDREEKEILVKLLTSPYKVSVKEDDKRNYAKAMQMLMDDYNLYVEECKKNKIKSKDILPPPQFLTNWNMVLFHVMYQNNFSIAIRLSSPIPDYYNNLPVGKSADYNPKNKKGKK